MSASPQPDEARPREHRSLSRLDLLKRAGVLGVAATAPVGLATKEAEARTIERHALETLSPAEADALDAVLGRLVPADALGVGAVGMGVAAYIDRALGGALIANRPSYQTNLAALDAHTQQAYGAVFSKVTDAQRDAVLTQMSSNTLRGFAPDSRTFFNLVKEHMLQGMFGDPYWGGNRNGAGWKLIGFPGISMNVRAADQRLNATQYSSTYMKSTYDFDQFKRGKA